jgi:hypothetical protein
MGYAASVGMVGHCFLPRVTRALHIALVVARKNVTIQKEHFKFLLVVNALQFDEKNSPQGKSVSLC